MSYYMNVEICYFMPCDSIYHTFRPGIGWEHVYALIEIFCDVPRQNLTSTLLANFQQSDIHQSMIINKCLSDRRVEIQALFVAIETLG